jgi:hypothetical protein
MSIVICPEAGEIIVEPRNIGRLEANRFSSRRHALKSGRHGEA